MLESDMKKGLYANWQKAYRNSSKPSQNISHKDFKKIMLQELCWRYHWPKGHFSWMSWAPKEMTPGFKILLFPPWKISVPLTLTILTGSMPNFMGTKIRKLHGQNSRWTNCFQFKASNFLIKLWLLTLIFSSGWLACHVLGLYIYPSLSYSGLFNVLRTSVMHLLIFSFDVR